MRRMTHVRQWLSSFTLDAALAPHVETVMCGLPQPVLDDFLSDPAFTLHDYDPSPGKMMVVPVRAPQGKSASRSIVLKRTLKRRPPEFVRWVIAHELAHAHLRNAGRFPGEDPEHAADALAASWGHPKPGERNAKR
jgi:hypothetical protein